MRRLRARVSAVDWSTLMNAVPAASAETPGAFETRSFHKYLTYINLARITYGTQVTLLIALAVWFRVSSLGAFPEHNADESYYGVQVAHLIQGEAIATRTMNHNLLNPFLVALQIPFYMLAGPSLWVLRMPAVVSGIVAVVLTYVIGSRIFDRTTALSAAIILATLPCAIYYSRLGLEVSQLPVFGLVLIALAIRGHGLGLLLAFLASMVVHPSAIFLMPIVLPLFLVRLFAADPCAAGIDRARRRRRIVVGISVALVVVAGASLAIFRHPVAQAYMSRRGVLDWFHFLDGYERLLFYLYNESPISKVALGLHRWVFRGVLLILLVFGVPQLVRRRQWERLALIVGLAASLAVFHIVAGPDLLRVALTHRYGVVFLLPTSLAIACLLSGMVPDRARPGASRPARHRLPLAIALTLGCGLLLSTKLFLFDPRLAKIGESIWTVQADAPDQYEQALSLIREDREQRQRSAGPISIVAHDYWTRLPVGYLASSTSDFEVLRLISHEEIQSRPFDELCREKQRDLASRLQAGGYVVTGLWVPHIAGGSIIGDTVRTSFPAGRVQRWDVADRAGVPRLIVYSLKAETAQLAPGQTAVTARAIGSQAAP
jgi:4-amino-4-deoxy-L-arabinose transferase-like glycosyltransferase